MLHCGMHETPTPDVSPNADTLEAKQLRDRKHRRPLGQAPDDRPIGQPERNEPLHRPLPAPTLRK